jgi:hypothetical protein
VVSLAYFRALGGRLDARMALLELGLGAFGACSFLSGTQWGLFLFSACDLMAFERGIWCFGHGLLAQFNKRSEKGCWPVGGQRFVLSDGVCLVLHHHWRALLFWLGACLSIKKPFRI